MNSFDLRYARVCHAALNQRPWQKCPRTHVKSKLVVVVVLMVLVLARLEANAKHWLLAQTLACLV